MQRGGQPIRTDGPERHLIEKKGTPTMGGVLILTAMTVSTLLWADLRSGYVWAVLFCTLGYGAVGFVDDYLKLSRRNTKASPPAARWPCNSPSAWSPRSGSPISPKAC